MYQGRRDPEIRIVVPSEFCNRYQSKASGIWIEIFTPPESIDAYKSRWGSIMVRPEQVCNIGRGMNVIRINDGAKINNSVKDDQHVVQSTEILTPDVITGRWLKFYRHQRFERIPMQDDVLHEILDIPSEKLYNDMLSLGQNMQFYMNRMPFDL